MMAYLERHRRAVAIVLMFCLVLVNVYSFQGRAHAFVISGTLALGVALCAFILVAAGLVFANSDAADDAANAFYDDQSEMIDSLIEHGKVIYRPYEEEAEQFKFVAGIGAAAWQTVVDWVHANYVSGTNGNDAYWDSSSIVDGTYYASNYSNSSSYIQLVGEPYLTLAAHYGYNPYDYKIVMTKSFYRGGSYPYCYDLVLSNYDCVYTSSDLRFTWSSTTKKKVLRVRGVSPDNLTQYSVIGTSNVYYESGAEYYSDENVVFSTNLYTYYPAYDSGVYANPETYANPLTGAHTVSVPLEATVLNPDLELDSGIGLKAGTPGAAVGLEEPDVLDLPVAGVEELPYAVPDNPADTVTDSTTGEQAKAADETQTSLKGLLLTKFPFCIPWDLMNAFKLLVANPEAPYFEVDFLEPLDIDWQGSTTIVFDMGEYPMIGQVSRWVFTVEFCIVLAVGTRKIIRA